MTEHTSGPETEQPLVTHLIELRNRLLWTVGVILVLFAALFPFSDFFYTTVATPLIQELPEGATMIATDPAGTFFTPMKLVLVLSIFAAVPYVLYQAWSFVAPGLYRHERRLVFPLLLSSTLLFYTGVLFAYFVVLPLIFQFFVAVTPEGVEVMTDIGKYLDFILKLFFAFGVAFEVPIATILLVWAGVTTPEKLSQMRPYIIVGAFIVGMMLTPPDVISQTLLALPMWLLFELGLFFSRYFIRSSEEEEEERDMDDELDNAIKDEQSLDKKD